MKGEKRRRLLGLLSAEAALLPGLFELLGLAVADASGGTIVA